MSQPAASATTNKRSRKDFEELDEGPSSLPQTKKSRQDACDGRRRDEEFWEDDGTIVLIARDVEFKVYKGVLAHHSTVFADMFSLPQPPTSSTSESPVVHLDDSPEDIRCVLRAILPRRQAKVIHNIAEEPTFDTISAYARMGHKYQIDELLTQSTDFLKQFFTTDLKQWLSHRKHVPNSWQDVHAIGVVNISRLVNCPSILPAALSVCCALPLRDCMRGFERADGSYEKLTECDLLRCIQGREDLTKAITSAFLRAFAPPSSDTGCLMPKRGRGRCQSGVRALLHSYGNGARSGCMPSEPFRQWSVGYRSDICSVCKARVVDQLRAEQATMWKRLPQILGVEVDGWVPATGRPVGVQPANSSGLNSDSDSDTSSDSDTTSDSDTNSDTDSSSDSDSNSDSDTHSDVAL